MNKAEKGTCPRCGKRYLIKDNDCIRRHNGPYPECFTTEQLPKEIHRAILTIALLGEENGKPEGTDNVRDTV